MPKSATDPTLSPELLAKYEPVIGLEVHAQLLTKTKIFCPCSTRFGDAPNSNTCPVCLGLPGTLPVLNKRVIEMASRASLALNCTVHEHSRFARKELFLPRPPQGLPDLPVRTPARHRRPRRYRNRRRKKTHRHHAPPRRRRRRQKSPRRFRAIRHQGLHRLQPLRLPARRNR